MQPFLKTICYSLVLLCILCVSPLLSNAQDPTPGNPEANPLPISLVSFSASISQKGTVVIKWQTTSEINASHFNVQRSYNGSDFSTVAQVTAVGNSSTTNNYTCSDNYSNATFMYYRLQNVDKNGSNTYSNIVKIDANNIYTNKVTGYPNPMVNNSFTVDVAQPVTAPIAYKIVNTNGQIVKQGTITQRQQLITCGALQKGNYLLQLATGQTIQVTK